MKLKFRMKKLLFITLAAVMCASVLYNGAFFAFSPKKASAAAGDGKYVRTELTVPNGQFNESSSSSFPKEPAQWTGEALNASNTSNMYNGIVQMYGPVYNGGDVLESYHLGEGVLPPANPFSESGFAKASGIDPDYNALMINTRETNGAYAYTSSAMTLEANTCYQIQVYAITFAFRESGAFIKLVDADTNLAIGRKPDSKKGVTENLMSFRSIDTSSYVRKDTMNWRPYTFIVQTSFTPVNIKVSLSVGDDSREPGYHSRKAKGVAFFDNITATTISREDYKQMAPYASSDFLVYSYEEEAAGRGIIEKGNTSYIENGNFTSAGNGGLFGWERIDYTNKGSVEYGIKDQMNSNNRDIPRVANLTEDNAFTPFKGQKTGDKENTALRISHPEKPKAADRGAGATGVISTVPFTIQRFRYYRLSIWFLTLDGAQANITLSMPDKSKTAETPRKTLPSATMSALSSAENSNTENWQQVSFYIKGSSVEDYNNVALELWLGYGDKSAAGTHSTGTVYFDKIEIQYLDSAEYNKYSGSGTAVVLDSFAAQSAVTNGNFSDVEYTDFDDFEIDEITKASSVNAPLSPASWTFVNGEDKTLNPKAVDFDYKDTAVTRGVIAGNDRLWTVPGQGNFNTVLMIDNAGASAAGYSSQDISVSSSSYQKISVRLYAEAGAKAFLQLTEGGSPIAVIENIEMAAGRERWTDYSFIVWTGDGASLKLTLWNGWCSQKSYEPYKNLSRGAVFFANVDSVSSTKEEYDLKSDGKDKTVKTVDMNSNFGLFDNSEGALKLPYRYTLSGAAGSNSNRDFKGGVLDTKNFTVKDAEELFTPEDKDGGKSSVSSNPGTSDESLRYILMLNNRVASAFKYTSVKSVTLSSSSYYKVTVSVKTAGLSGTGNYGAYIGLSGIPSKKGIEPVISGIKSDDKYTAYTFYIATGDESFTFNYEMGLGDVNRPSTSTKGYAFFENMSYESMNKVDFANAGATETDVKLSFITSAAETPENDIGKSFWDWYWLPTVLFGAALLFVLITLGVRRLVPALVEIVAVRKRNKTAASFDRATGETKRKAAAKGDDGYTDIIETAGAKRARDTSGADKPGSAEEKQEGKSGEAYDDYFED